MDNNEKKFCVYAHFKGADQKNMFYVGKGSHKRAYAKSNRGLHWKNVVVKHGYNVLILYDQLNEPEAFDLEVRFIALYRAMGHNLVNKTNGGEGCSGRVCTEETKQKIGKANSGINNPMFGKIPSEATRQKISEAHIGRQVSDETRFKMSRSMIGNLNSLGRIVSQETRQKSSASQKGRIKSLNERKHLSESLRGRKAWNAGTHESGMKGKKHSPETKQKMREARLKNPTIYKNSRNRIT